jgi:hypothetical protein
MRRSRLPRLGGLASHAIGYADHGSGDHSQGSAPARRQGQTKRLPLKAARLGAAGDCGYTPAGAGKARVMAAVRFETFSRA